MSPYAELNPSDSLLDSDDVSRYCRPSDYDRTRCEPKVGAFQRRPSEVDASVNRIQHFQLPDAASAIVRIREEFLAKSYDLKPNGRFVVFNVGKAKHAAIKAGNYKLVFKYTPDPPILSHSSIFNFPDDPNEERTIAIAIKRLVTRFDIYYAVP